MSLENILSLVDLKIIIQVILIIIVTIVVFKVLSRLIRSAARRARVQKGKVDAIVNVIEISMGGIAVISILGSLQIDVTGLVAGIGIGALAVGFAAQTVISNLISGLFLFFEGVFKLGDFLQAGDVTGKVVGMGFRTTQLETVDGNIVTIPNSILASSQVINLTSGKNELLLTIEEIIDIYADHEKAKELILEAVGEIEGVIIDPRHQPVIMVERDPGQWRTILKLYASSKAFNWHLIQSNIRERIKAKFDAHGIIPPVPPIARYRIESIKEEVKNLKNR